MKKPRRKSEAQLTSRLVNAQRALAQPEQDFIDAQLALESHVCPHCNPDPPKDAEEVRCRSEVESYLRARVQQTEAAAGPFYQEVLYAQKALDNLQSKRQHF